ncbi:MAG: hypothetical protein DRP14_03175 [Candidatus Aenigmatarchaeota archaeon]|nr:MAG: hypothetical protein DRP14_03175 [Candidatus Aenigmarchaeota archaeon]
MVMKLNEVERELWIKFHEKAYKEDLALAKEIAEKYPRWSIIAGYYAMHDLAKLYLGKVYNIKISGQNIHRQTIDELKKVIKDKNKELISLLETAEREVKELGIDSVPYLLILGKKERGKAQYYSSSQSIDYSKKAKWFLNEVVRLFVKIVEDLIC